MKKYADSPYGVSLAIAIASSSVAKRAIPATGPNVSSQLICHLGVTPVSIDGWKNCPSIRAPPRTSSAPSARAFATWRSTFCDRRPVDQRADLDALREPVRDLRASQLQP